MENLSCFKCSHILTSVTSRCGRCGWNGGAGVVESNDCYLVFLSLVLRAAEEGEKVMPYIYRIAATPRELAVLEHGDQGEIDGAKWRISGKNITKQTFFLKGFRIIQFRNRQFFEFEADDPVDDIKVEMLRWRNLHSAYYEIWELKKKKQLQGYLKRPESKKAIYRSRIQDESPYLN